MKVTDCAFLNDPRDADIARLRAEVERLKLERGIALDTAKQLQAQVLALKSWQESVLAEVGSEPVRFAINCDHEYEGEWCLACEANHYEAKCLHLAAKLVDAQSWQESTTKAVQTLMKRLTDLLDEDHFNNIAGIIDATGIQPPDGPPAPLNAAQIEDAIMGTRVEAPQPLPGKQCTCCYGRGEVGGLTPQGYETEECPHCKGTGIEGSGAKLPGEPNEG